MTDSIAIIGLACRFPGASDSRAYWQLLTEGRDAITEIPPDRWRVNAFLDSDPAAPGRMISRYGGFLNGLDGFDGQFFRMSPREAVQLDPRQRLTLELAWEALEDAGVPPSRLSGSQTGVFIATLSANYGSILFNHYLDSVDAYSGSGNGNSVAANRISYFLNLHGPSMAIDTACSGSLVAVHLACESLRSGESTVALAGGVNVILKPDDSIFFSKTGALASDGRCRVFDRRAEGIARSEGAGVVLLKPTQAALADGDRIYAVIRGSAVNQDGATNGLMSPSEQAQRQLLENAYARAGVRPADVQYIEAHGTGTAIGDPVEVRALAAALTQGRAPGERCALGSVKSNIGHSEAAAGIAGLIKTALALHNRQLPPNLHFEEPNPLIPFDHIPLYVQTALGPWPEPSKRLVAGVSAFGFAGTNAHVVLEQAPSQRGRVAGACDDPGAPHILPLSAKSVEALRELAGAYAKQLKVAGDTFDELCRAASLHRDHLERRCAVVADTAGEAGKQLDAFCSGSPAEAHTSRSHLSGGPIVFVFAGQGSHWPRMGASLMRSEPVFARALEECDAALHGLTGWSLLAILARDNEHAIDRTEVAQPAIFAIQVALTALLNHWGIHPDAVIGHSLGEVAAAHAAGAISLDDAVPVVHHRSRLMQRTAGCGATASVALPEEQVREWVDKFAGRLSLAGVNSPVRTIVSGEPAAIDELIASLSSAGAFARRLDGIDVAFHSYQMEPLREELESALYGFSGRREKLPLFTSLCGGRVKGDALDAAYWGRNLRDPFHFQAAFSAVRRQGGASYVEVSPHPVLHAALDECLRHHNDQAAVVPTLRRGAAERASLLNALAVLYTRGHNVRWDAVQRGSAKHIELPHMPWQRQRYWYDQLPQAENESGFNPRTGGKSTPVADLTVFHPLLTSHLTLASPAGAHVWTKRLTTHEPSYMRDHLVHGRVVFPAAGYAEIALTAAAQISGAGSLLVEDLEIFRPLILAADDSVRQMQITAMPKPGNKWCVEVHADAGGTGHAKAGWLMHGRALVRSAGQTERKTVDTAALRARCRQEIEPGSHLETMEANGLRYGPSFRVLRGIWRGQGEAFGRLQLPVALQSGAAEYRLHPCLLDAAIQLVACAAPRNPNELPEARLPVGMREIHAYRPISNELWCHAVLRQAFSHADDVIEANLQLIDDNDEVLACVEGLRLRRVDAVAEPVATDLSEWFYAVRWQPSALPAGFVGESRETLPIAAIASRMQPKIERWSDENNLSHYARHPAYFDRLAAAYIENAFLALGWAARPGDHFTTESLASRLAVASRHSRFFDRLIRILAEERILRSEGNGWRVDRSLVFQDVALIRSETARIFPHAQTELALIARAGEKLGDVLQDRCSALAVLFPNESDRLLQNLYEDTVFTRVYNQIVADAVAQACEPANDRPIRILEIGAGTGATTSAVLDGLPTSKIQYAFTDQSRMLLDRATRRFAGDARLSFRALDIEIDPVAQGFEAADYDVVIAANVLHATRQLRKTLSNVSRLLRPGGLLVILEGPGPQRWFDLIVGGTEGWWRFADDDLRPDYPLVSREAWISLLRDSGFGESTALIDSGGAPPQYVVLSRWSGARPFSPMEASGGRIWFVLGDRMEPGESLAGRLSEIDTKAVVVCERELDGWIVRFREFVARHVPAWVGVIDLWALDFPPEDIRLDGVESRVCAPILDFVNAASQFPQSIEFRCWLVTRGCQAAVETDGQLAVAQAPLWGIGRVMAGEHPGWFGGLIDLDPEPSPADVEQLLQQIGAGDSEDQVAFRGGMRYVARLARQEVGSPANPVLFRPEASYLITGGLSGIGLATARWMAERGARRLLILSRTPLPSRGEWTNLKTGDPAAARVAAVRELESRGVTVHVEAVDVGDEEALAAFLKSYEVQGWPTIRGVVHSAGLIEDRLLINMDEACLARVARPKIRGAWALHRHFMQTELDCFVLFSSGTSLMGTIGQGNYAAGNAFLDALAQHRRALGLPATCINWGVWHDTGIIARSGLREQLRRSGLIGIREGDGMRALERVISSELPQVGAMPTDWPLWRQAHAFAASRRFLSALAAEQDQNEDAEASESSDNSFLEMIQAAAPEERSELVRQAVTKMAAKVLRVEYESLTPSRLLNEFGMDSIMAVELKDQIESGLGVSVSVVELLQGETIGSIAARVVEKIRPRRQASESPKDQSAEILPRPRPDGLAPAAPIQQAIWTVQQRAPGDATYNLPVVVYMARLLDPEILKRSVDEVVRRHSVLRTTFRLEGGELKQVIAASAPAGFEVFHTDGASEAELKPLLHDLSSRPFDLGVAPLLRISLLQRLNDSVLVLNVHHAIFDGWSAGVFIHELHALYSAFEKNQRSPLPEPRLQYADVVEWKLERLREGAYADQLAYWRGHLGGGALPLRLGDRVSGASTRGAKRYFVVPPALTVELEMLGRRAGATPFVILLTAFKTLLYGLCQQEVITVGIAEASRDHPETKGMIGCFVNMLALRTSVTADLGFLDLVGRVRETALAGFANKQIHFEHAIRGLRGWDVRRPIQAAFALQNAPMELPPVVTGFVQLDNGSTHFDLSLNLTRVGGQLEGFFEYDTACFDDQAVAAIVERYVSVLQKAVASPERRLASILFGVKDEGLPAYGYERGLHAGQSQRFGF